MYELTNDNLHIVDSYKARKRDMRSILNSIEYTDSRDGEMSNVWLRSRYSLVSEWCVHNLCYNLHIARERTKDVDLNYPCPLERVYKAIGWIAWIFIK